MAKGISGKSEPSHSWAPNMVSALLAVQGRGPVLRGADKYRIRPQGVGQKEWERSVKNWRSARRAVTGFGALLSFLQGAKEGVSGESGTGPVSNIRSAASTALPALVLHPSGGGWKSRALSTLAGGLGGLAAYQFGVSIGKVGRSKKASFLVKVATRIPRLEGLAHTLASGTESGRSRSKLSETAKGVAKYYGVAGTLGLAQKYLLGRL